MVNLWQHTGPTPVPQLPLGVLDKPFSIDKNAQRSSVDDSLGRKSEELLSTLYFCGNGCDRYVTPGTNLEIEGPTVTLKES